MTSLSSNSTRRPRSVIVTGGASGLGKSMSAHFAALGDAVTILDVNVSLGAAVTDELNNNNSNNNDARGRGRVGFRKCDISSWEEQKEAFRDVWAREGRVDVVVANAGVSEGGRSWVVPPAEGLEGELEGNGDGELLEAPRLRVLDVNLVGNVYCTLHFPHIYFHAVSFSSSFSPWFVTG
jgi:NAD(P)-dependent dehydrogenase (short-subunit alcohol dehydrogenase family)